MAAVSVSVSQRAAVEAWEAVQSLPIVQSLPQVPQNAQASRQFRPKERNSLGGVPVLDIHPSVSLCACSSDRLHRSARPLSAARAPW